MQARCAAINENCARENYFSGVSTVDLLSTTSQARTYWISAKAVQPHLSCSAWLGVPKCKRDNTDPMLRSAAYAVVLYYIHLMRY